MIVLVFLEALEARKMNSLESYSCQGVDMSACQLHHGQLFTDIRIAEGDLLVLMKWIASSCGP